MEEEHLSQKMKGLSTNTVTAKAIVLLTDVIPIVNHIPSHLRKRYPAFKELLHQILSSMGISKSDEKGEELRRIVLMMYKIKIIQLHYHLWTTYLEAGTGQLIRSSQERFIYSINEAIWPVVIRHRFTSKAKTRSDMAELCHTFVQQSLDALHKNLQQYQLELDLKVRQCQIYSPGIQQTLEHYLEQELQRLRRQIQHEIQLVHYDYHIRAIKLEYQRQQPSPYQKQLMKQLCQAKYDQETAEQEYHFVKKQLAYYSLPVQSFDASTLARSLLMTTVEDAVIRQEFYNRFKKMAEEGRAKMFDLYLKTAERERILYKEKYDDSVKTLSSDYQAITKDGEIPRVMVDLINARCQKISERIQCVYQWKEQCIESPAK